MRSLRTQKVIRDLWLHRSRSSLVIAAICIGIIGAGCVLDTWSLVNRAMHEGYDASRPASAVIRTDSVSAALLTQIRALPEIASAEARRVVGGRVHTSNGTHSVLITANGDYAKNEIGRIASQTGAWPPPDNELVVESSSVEFASIAIGDTLGVTIGDSLEQRLRVAGIARDVGVAPGWMEHLVYLYVTPATLGKLGTSSALNEIQIRVRDNTLDRAGVRVIATRVRNLVEATGRTVSDVNVPVPGKHIHAGQIESLLMTQGAFAFLALLLSSLLVVNLISAMLTGQVREIGIMKAIGGSDAQISTMYFGLALALGVVASVISIPTAAYLGRKYAEFTGSLLNFGVAGFAIPRWSFVLQAIVGVVLPVAAASIPIRHGCRIPVGEALRDLGLSGASADRNYTFLNRFDGISRPVLLSLRNAFRRRQRMILTLATLTTGGAIFLGALNLKASVVGAVDLMFEPQHFDVSFRLAQALPADSITRAFRSTQGVKDVEAWAGARGQVIGSDGRTNSTLSITAPPQDTKLLSVALTSGRWVQAAADVNELVVNDRQVAEDSAFSVGREVTLRISGRVAKWIVVGVTPAGPSAQGFTARETLERLAGQPVATSAMISTAANTPASRLALIRRVRDELPDRGVEIASSSLLSEQRKIIEDHMLMVAGFLGNMSLLMIVVGGLGLASTMSLAVLERTREIGILRAIGAEHLTILAMIQIEGLVIATVSWALAIPISIPMSVALGQAFGRVMLPLPVRFLPVGLAVLEWLAVAVIVSLVACAWPALRATRITTSAALSYE